MKKIISLFCLFSFCTKAMEKKTSLKTQDYLDKIGNAFLSTKLNFYNPDLKEPIIRQFFVHI